MSNDKFNLGGLGNLMKGAKKLQGMMEKTQEELAKTEIIGESGAGAVKVILDGRRFAKDIEIDNNILEEPKEILEQLIVAAFNDATQKAEEITHSKMLNVGQILGSLTGSDSDNEK